MKNKLKIQDLENFQEDLSQEFATDLSSIKGGMLAEITDSVSLPDERLIAHPLPQPEPKPYPLPLPWPPYPYPCGCYPYPDKPIKIDSKDGVDSIFIGWCPVIL